ncbi:MAG: hypothetical protein SGARI_002087 [Bacillariaceae sp.]
MQWQPPAVIWQDMQRTTIPLIVSGLKLWPAVHVITYGVIPVENRLLWVDFVEIVWVIMLSTQAASKGTQVLEMNEQEMALLLDEDNDDHTVILHSQLIPEHFYGDRDETTTNGGFVDLEKDYDYECPAKARRSSSILERIGIHFNSFGDDGNPDAAPASMEQSYQHASSSRSTRRESLPALLRHRREESLLAGHHSHHRRRGSLVAAVRATPVRGYYFGGQIWVL